MKELDDITGAIVDAAVKIHKELGPGLLESVYEVVLAQALGRQGFHVERQKPVNFEYDGVMFEEGFRADSRGTSSAFDRFSNPRGDFARSAS